MSLARRGLLDVLLNRELMRWARRGLLYVLLFMLPISKAAIEIAFPLLLVTWVAEISRKPRGWHDSIWAERPARPVLIDLAAFIGLCAASLLTTTSWHHTVNGLFRKTSEYLLFFLLAADLGKDLTVLRTGLRVLLVSAAVVCVDGLVQEFTGHEPLLGHTLELHFRMTGPYENPNDLASFLLVIVPLITAALFMKRPVLPKPALWAILLLTVGCLIRTMYVLALVSLAFGSLVFTALHKPAAKPIWRLGSVLLIIAVVAQTLRGTQWQNLFALYDRSGAATGLQDRLWMWSAAWNMMLAHPWTGVGLNAFMENYLIYRVGGEAVPRYAHNCYLQVGAELGMFGLAAFLALMMTIVRTVLNAWRAADAPDTRLLFAGLTASLIAFLALATADTNFYAIRHATLFWVLAGMAVGAAIARGALPPERPGHAVA